MLKPLPYLLQGTVERSLQGIIREVRPDGSAVVQLRWEAVPERLARGGWQPEPEASPLLGLLEPPRMDRGRISRRSGADSGEDGSEEPTFTYREGQAVGVTVRALMTAAGQEVGMLPVELAKDQPLEPLQVPKPIAASAKFSDWQAYSQEQRFKVAWSVGKGSEQASPPLPPKDWSDAVWAPVLQLIPKELRGRAELKQAAFTAWALADGGRDILVEAPMMKSERALMYFGPVVRHLRAQKRRRTAGGGCRPAVFVLSSDPSMMLEIGSLFTAGGLSVTQTKPGQKSEALGDVWVGVAADLDYALQADPEGFLSTISFLVLDDLRSLSKEPTLVNLLQAMPERLWGPTMVWNSFASTYPTGFVCAFTSRMSRLMMGMAVREPQDHSELVLHVDIHKRVAQYMHNFPNERVLVFAEDAEAQIEMLRSSDALGRLDEPDDSPSLVRVVPSAAPWASLAPFDVVLQAAPLPGRGENYRRLASCRKFAVVLTAVDADQAAKEVKVMPGWEPKSMTATRKTSSSKHSQRRLTRLSSSAHRTRMQM
mmetsp:Transcript_72847/g.235485  ORF Transcript_72847/g.235485 Transcript_72847/m.235485 type:complete len:540 (+) Transcript_72847:428-2047(+)